MEQSSSGELARLRANNPRPNLSGLEILLGRNSPPEVQETIFANLTLRDITSLGAIPELYGLPSLRINDFFSNTKIFRIQHGPLFSSAMLIFNTAM